jgi:hypothetical protein
MLKPENHTGQLGQVVTATFSKLFSRKILPHFAVVSEHVEHLQQLRKVRSENQSIANRGLSAASSTQMLDHYTFIIGVVAEHLPTNVQRDYLALH